MSGFLTGAGLGLAATFVFSLFSVAGYVAAKHEMSKACGLPVPGSSPTVAEIAAACGAPARGEARP